MLRQKGEFGIVGVFFSVIGGLIAATVVGLLLWRWRDLRDDAAEWRRLQALQPRVPAIFEPAMVAALPEPARRYFAFTIQPGAPLWPVAEIDMEGQFSLGTKQAPKYQPMAARQILAAPDGFVWSMRLRGGMKMSGSDSGTWTRFWLFGLIPVARMGGTADHARSAYGRCVAEAVFWTPAALLPGPDVTWEPVNADTARVTVRRDGMGQSVDVTVDAEGRPVRVFFQRWSDANPQHTHRWQPFGGDLSEFREVGGYRLPFRAEGGNMYGTDGYFPFFIAQVTDIRFPTPGGASAWS